MKVKPACQLLTALDGTQAAACLLDAAYAVQQKFDGERILLHVEKHSVTAYNRNGLQTTISRDILTEAKRFIPLAPLMFDGEWIRKIKSFYSFDLLELAGTNLQTETFIDRTHVLSELLQSGTPSSIHAARTETEEAGKIALLTQIRDSNLEGIVLKRLKGFYLARREPHDYKYKFTHDASFIVLRRNQNASVDLGLYDSNHKLIEVGSVAVRNSYFDRNIEEGTVLDVRYSHAFRDTNHIYQPRMIKIRKNNEVKPETCRLSQLRYKAVNPIAI